ncbi:MAG: TATA box-binding protein, partial [Nitrosopumilus sp.]
LHHPKTVALIFASGRIVCVGAKSSKEIQNSVNTVHMELQEHNLILCDDMF